LYDAKAAAISYGFKNDMINKATCKAATQENGCKYGYGRLRTFRTSFGCNKKQFAALKIQQ
jgi:hypothetical protein